MPSHIPARTFALALFETLAPASEGPMTVERLQCRAKAFANCTVADVRREIAQLADVSEAVRDQLRAVAAAGTPLAAVRAGVQQFAAADVLPARAILAFIDNQQAIGKALLSLIAQSVNARTVLMSVDDVQQILQHPPDFDDKAQVVSAISPARTLDAMRKAALRLPESNARTAVLRAIDAGQEGLMQCARASKHGHDNAMARSPGYTRRRNSGA